MGCPGNEGDLANYMVPWCVVLFSQRGGKTGGEGNVCGPLSVCLPVPLSVCLSVCLSLCE